MPSLDDLSIRTELKPGDMGYLIYLHAALYKKEYEFGPEFEKYVARTMLEFWDSYDPARDRAWICEDKDRIVGSIFLKDRGEAAQLRYFLIKPEYRGIGLGKKLMALFMEYLGEQGYKSCYLLTTDELRTAASLYRRYGFVLTEETPSTAFGRPVTDQKYELKNVKFPRG